MSPRRTVLLLALAGAGVLARPTASAQRATPSVPAAPRPQLEGTLAIVGPQPAHRASELRLRATVRNNAHQTWLAPVFVLSAGALSVDVVDASGRRVPTVPPPVPPAGPMPREPLAQGQSRTFEISLNLFSPELAPGTYTATWGAREGIHVAAPARFVIAP